MDEGTTATTAHLDRGRVSPRGGSCTAVGSPGEVVGNSGAFPPRVGESRGINKIGFHVRRAVMLVRATATEAAEGHNQPYRLTRGLPLRDRVRFVIEFP
jgi:hypothetical protein